MVKKKVVKKTSARTRVRPHEAPASTTASPKKKAVPAKKIVAKKKPTADSAADAKKGRVTTPAKSAAELDQFGMRKGSDLSIAAHEMVQGGEERREVTRRIRERLADTKTRNGHAKPVSSIMTGAMQRLLAQGFVIESSWKMTAPVQDNGTKTKRSKRSTKTK